VIRGAAVLIRGAAVLSGERRSREPIPGPHALRPDARPRVQPARISKSTRATAEPLEALR
jgi:hypothetical protein